MSHARRRALAGRALKHAGAKLDDVATVGEEAFVSHMSELLTDLTGTRST